VSIEVGHDCQTGDVHLTDDFGTAATDDVGAPFTVGRKLECDIKFGRFKISVPVWEEGI
jgi:hypothetical protein